MDVVVLLILAIIAVYVIVIHNSLVSLRNRFKHAFAQIDVQLQRRHELVPRLAETAKAYMAHESETLSEIIAARNQAVKAGSAAALHPDNGASVRSLLTAETALNNSLGRLFALVENYPDIKADQTMRQLMAELTVTENKVSFARQSFNDAAMAYNTYREQFPHSIIAAYSGFNLAVLFRMDAADYKQPVKISF